MWVDTLSNFNYDYLMIAISSFIIGFLFAKN